MARAEKKQSKYAAAMERVKPTPVQILDAKPVGFRDQALMSAWQENTFAVLEKMKVAIADDKSRAAREWSTSAGIGTDKILVLSGRPTQIVAGLHEVRHTLPAVAERLLAVAHRLGIEAPK